MKIATLVVASLALAGTPAAAHAQQGATFAVSGGASVPLGDLGDFTSTGYHVQLSLEGRPPAVAAPTLRVDGLYAGFGGKDGGAGVNLWTINANIVFNAARDRASGGVRPYFLGGVGYYNVKPDLDGAEGRGVFGFDAGAGLNFELGEGLGAFVEARYHHALNAFEGGLLTGEDRPARFVPVTFGIRF